MLTASPTFQASDEVGQDMTADVVHLESFLVIPVFNAGGNYLN